MSRSGDPWQPTTHAEKDARIAELEAKLAAALGLVEVYRRERDEAEARIAAVIALCDEEESDKTWGDERPWL